MDKAKIKFVVEIEYEQNPKFYPPGSTREDMLKIDIAGAEEDPFTLLDVANATWTTTGELL